VPARAYIAASSGEDRLVPPTWNQPDWPWNGIVSKTANPEFGSASAETSAVALLFGQLVAMPFW